MNWGKRAAKNNRFRIAEADTDPFFENRNSDTAAALYGIAEVFRLCTLTAPGSDPEVDQV